MASDQESCSDEEPDSEMLSDDLCLPDSDDDRQSGRNVQVRIVSNAMQRLVSCGLCGFILGYYLT